MNQTEEWSGTSRLWLAPGEDAHESQTTAQMSSVGQGQFITIRYRWEFEDEPQDGMIAFRSEMDQALTRAVWLDSWHMRNDIMVCEAMTRDGVVSIQGSYAAPPGPDWGWRIEIETGDASSLVIRMINITPLGEEALAVLAQYERSGAQEPPEIEALT